MRTADHDRVVDIYPMTTSLGRLQSIHDGEYDKLSELDPMAAIIAPTALEK